MDRKKIENLNFMPVTELGITELVTAEINLDKHSS